MAGRPRRPVDPVWGFVFIPLVTPGRHSTSRWPDNRRVADASFLHFPPSDRSVGRPAPSGGSVDVHSRRFLSPRPSTASYFCPDFHIWKCYYLTSESGSRCIFHFTVFFFTCMAKCCRTAGAGPVGGFALSLFVLCTALLILDPIMIITWTHWWKEKNLVQRSLCVYVNNTKATNSRKDKKKRKKSIRSDAMVTTSEESAPPPRPSVLVALPSKLGVSLTE